VIRRAAARAILAGCIAGFAACAADPASRDPRTAKGGDPAAGLVVARTWCATCHDIGDRTPAVGPRQGPGFVSIARRADPEQAGLRQFLDGLHPPMPTYRLWDSEKRDLLAHFLVLRYASEDRK